MPNVSVEGEQTGGLVLTSPVASSLAFERLAQTPNPSDRWIIVLPTDVRKTSEAVKVSIQETAAIGGMAKGIAVDIPETETLPLSNTLLNSDTIRIGRNVFNTPTRNDMSILDAFRLQGTNTSRIAPGAEERYISIRALLSRDKFPNNQTLNSHFGDFIDTVNSTVFITYGALQAVPPTYDKILQVEGKPVFLAANTS